MNDFPPEAATACPSCQQTMTRLELPQKSFGELALDICFPCQGIWFDQFESMQLTPGAIIDLFRRIHEHADDPRNPLATRLHCPRCQDVLKASLDVARGGRFTYHRCLQNHGRFTVFAQFMIEKGFVRQLAPVEVKALAARIGIIHCTGCGAPVDIRSDAACSHCGAPIAILDPAAVEHALDTYRQSENTRVQRDPEALAEAILAANRPRPQHLSTPLEMPVTDLILSGLAIVHDLFDR
jgi:hypothetical protein